MFFLKTNVVIYFSVDVSQIFGENACFCHENQCYNSQHKLLVAVFAVKMQSYANFGGKKYLQNDNIGPS
jgi:hypothetical protein